MRRVLGSPVDDHTRCTHYRTPLDVVAIMFRCCREYYPCHLCHEESAGHPAVPWPAEEHDTAAVLCGVCRHELTVRQYLEVDACPQCAAPFNPRCRLHAHLYFEPAHQDGGAAVPAHRDGGAAVPVRAGASCR